MAEGSYPVAIVPFTRSIERDPGNVTTVISALNLNATPCDVRVAYNFSFPTAAPI